MGRNWWLRSVIQATGRQEHGMVCGHLGLKTATFSEFGSAPWAFRDLLRCGRAAFRRPRSCFDSWCGSCDKSPTQPGHVLNIVGTLLWNKKNPKNIKKKNIVKNFFDLYIVHDTKCFDQRWSGHWVKTLFPFIFVTCERYVTNLRGTFVPVPISTHPTLQYEYKQYAFSCNTVTFIYLDLKKPCLRLHVSFFPVLFMQNVVIKTFSLIKMLNDKIQDSHW
jgi:hypothetical protein